MLLLHSRQKVLENITCGYGNHLWKYWIYHLWPSATRDKFNTSLVITITTRDIFQYLLPGVDQLLNCHVYLNFHFVLNYLSYWGAIGLICSLNFNQPSSPTFFRFFFFLKKISLVLEILNHCPVQFRKLNCATKKEQLYLPVKI